MVKVRRQSLNVAQTRFRTGLGPADAIVQASIDLENDVRLEASTRLLLIMQQDLLARLMGEGPDTTQNLFAGKGSQFQHGSRFPRVFRSSFSLTGPISPRPCTGPKRRRSESMWRKRSFCLRLI